MTKVIKGIAISGLLLATSGVALASSPNCLLDYSCGYGTQQAKYPGLNNALITGTAIQSIQANSQAFSARAFALGGSPMAVSRGTTKGMAAGGAGPKINLWGSFNQNKAEDTRVGQDFNTDIDNAVVGLDYQLSSGLVVGASFAMDDGDGLNNKSLGFGGNKFTTHGYSVAPYLGWQISNNLALDATVGMGEGKLGSTGITAKADRVFGGLNLTYGQWFGNWQLLGKAGYAYAEEKYNSAGGVPGPTNKLSQGRVGAQLSYLYANGVAPYVGLTFVADSDVSPKAAAASNWDKTAVVSTIGVNLFSAKSDVYGGVNYTDESRSHTNNHSWNVNLGLRF